MGMCTQFLIYTWTAFITDWWCLYVYVHSQVWRLGHYFVFRIQQLTTVLTRSWRNYSFLELDPKLLYHPIPKVSHTHAHTHTHMWHMHTHTYVLWYFKIIFLLEAYSSDTKSKFNVSHIYWWLVFMICVCSDTYITVWCHFDLWREKSEC